MKSGGGAGRHHSLTVNSNVVVMFGTEDVLGDVIVNTYGWREKSVLSRSETWVGECTGYICKGADNSPGKRSHHKYSMVNCMLFMHVQWIGLHV